MRILIADDHTMVRESLVKLLEAGGDVQVVAQAADGIEAIEKAELTRPDIVVADLTMPTLGGLEVVRRLREKLPNTKVLILTMHQEDEYVLQAVRAGASGYLVKDSAGSELLAAVRSLHAGRGHFGPQASKASFARWAPCRRRPPATLRTSSRPGRTAVRRRTRS